MRDEYFERTFWAGLRETRVGLAWRDSPPAHLESVFEKDALIVPETMFAERGWRGAYTVAQVLALKAVYTIEGYPYYSYGMTNIISDLYAERTLGTIEPIFLSVTEREPSQRGDVTRLDFAFHFAELEMCRDVLQVDDFIQATAARFDRQADVDGEIIPAPRAYERPWFPATYGMLSRAMKQRYPADSYQRGSTRVIPFRRDFLRSGKPQGDEPKPAG